MLRALHIENAALIRRLDMELEQGFTVFTGETGAGKSIIIGSLGLLTGARADKDLIRTGEDKAIISGLFSVDDERIIKQLKELDIEPDENGDLLLSRTLTLDGRSNCRINGKSVPLSYLRVTGQALIAIHGQHDTKSLLDPASHLVVLDRFAANEGIKTEYQTLYRQVQSLKSELSALIKEKAETKRMSELLYKQVKEIDAVSPKEGEVEALEQRKKLLQNARQLRKQAGTIVHALYKNEKGVSACDLVSYAINAVTAIGQSFPDFEATLEKLTEFQLEMENIAETASALAGLAEEDPEAVLSEIDDRLASIRILQKRYGPEIKDVLLYAEDAKKKLQLLEEGESKEGQLKDKLEKLVLAAREKALQLHESRENAAKTLKETVTELLAYLDLGKVSFETPVTLQYNDKNVLLLSSEGADSFEFLISANKGEPPKPIARIASGGELSRIMLALKTALTDSEETPTLIFDEIDTGISGKTSQKIGLLMQKIATNTQILCVTHSAQLASCAHSHYKISKSESEGRTETSLAVLDKDGRVDELARILGGIEITDTVRRNAKELLGYNKNT